MFSREDISELITYTRAAVSDSVPDDRDVNLCAVLVVPFPAPVPQSKGHWDLEFAYRSA